VTQTSELRKAIVTQSRSHRDGPPSPQLRAIAPAGTMETYSAGIKLAQVARGEADIYLNTYPAFHDWDVCAGHILVTEAGGTVTGLRGEPIHYGQKEASQRTGLVASNSKLHAALVGALQKV
jgi:3'(2'), 5'-bisphosphate nucleotidase